MLEFLDYEYLEKAVSLCPLAIDILRNRLKARS